MGDSFLIAFHDRAPGLYCAYEYVPGVGEESGVWRESPSDLADAITAAWTPLTIYTNGNHELADDLSRWLTGTGFIVEPCRPLQENATHDE
jgi:hypothetical protein